MKRINTLISPLISQNTVILQELAPIHKERLLGFVGPVPPPLMIRFLYSF